MSKIAEAKDYLSLNTCGNVKQFFLGGGADKKLDFSMILDQDSGDTQEDFSLPRTF